MLDEETGRVVEKKIRTRNGNKLVSEQSERYKFLSNKKEKRKSFRAKAKKIRVAESGKEFRLDLI